MINLNDFIVDKHNKKKYRFTCDECSKDRGYLFKNARGGKLTGSLCLTCKNATQMVVKTNGYCEHCKESHILPKISESNDHWYWDINLNSKNGGYFRCKSYLKEKDKRWGLANPAKLKYKRVITSSKYRAAKLNATPKNLSKEDWDKIDSFYKEAKRLENETGIKYHVDHIVPLQGRNGIKGAHAPWNLQILTAKENLKKSNKLITDII